MYFIFTLCSSSSDYFYTCDFYHISTTELYYYYTTYTEYKHTTTSVSVVNLLVSLKYSLLDLIIVYT